jgi:hypothetical protein
MVVEIGINFVWAVDAEYNASKINTTHELFSIWLLKGRRCWPFRLSRGGLVSNKTSSGKAEQYKTVRLAKIEPPSYTPVVRMPNMNTKNSWFVKTVTRR